MSVLITGMKMPKDCTECRFAFDGRCFANWGRKSKIDVTNYCPLVELPAHHGRLIDADEMLNKYYNGSEDGRHINYAGVITPMTVGSLPTIIEAEGEP